MARRVCPEVSGLWLCGHIVQLLALWSHSAAVVCSKQPRPAWLPWRGTTSALLSDDHSLHTSDFSQAEGTERAGTSQIRACRNASSALLPCVERPHIAWMSSEECSHHQLSQRNGEEDPSVNPSTYTGSPLQGKQAFSSCWHAQLGCKWIFLFVKYQARVVAQFFLFRSNSVLPNYVQLLEVRMNHQRCETKWLGLLAEFSLIWKLSTAPDECLLFGSFSFQILFVLLTFFFARNRRPGFCQIIQIPLLTHKALALFCYWCKMKKKQSDLIWWKNIFPKYFFIFFRIKSTPGFNNYQNSIVRKVVNKVT